MGLRPVNTMERPWQPCWPASGSHSTRCEQCCVLYIVPCRVHLSCAAAQGQVHENLSAEQVTALCSELAGEDHGQAGACVVYITGCGDNRGVLEGVDGGTVAISTLTEAFDAEGCPGLLHKPKLFIADLCAREHSELVLCAHMLLSFHLCSHAAALRSVV
eukprot:TRINITY_DN3333_c0_g1_i7.p1 TRINITY_DN3333_c0_g1~~TRINITY_DN3333_c0_g1_i7.p1  ORF type:complete len:160 (-),score=46.87 TRINITY_DN3333_c0_g1_i7:474-953(-)